MNNQKRFLKSFERTPDRGYVGFCAAITKDTGLEMIIVCSSMDELRIAWADAAKGLPLDESGVYQVVVSKKC
jgi:hypothetical protein